MVMAGPDNFAGYVSPAQHDQRAIARTAGYLLGVSMPLADGVVMDDLLLEPSTPLAVPGTGTSSPRLALAVFPNPTRSGAEVRVSGVPASRSARGADRRERPPSGHLASRRLGWRHQQLDLGRPRR
jgi:hypothetical protein